MKLNAIKAGDPLRYQSKTYTSWVASGDTEIHTISLETERGYLRVDASEVEVVK